MNRFQIKTLIIFNVLLIQLLWGVNCDLNRSDVEPCDLVTIPGDVTKINCNGVGITDSTLWTLSAKLSGTFYQLSIRNTSVTRIGDGQFANSSFVQIIVEDNDELETIHANAFNRSGLEERLVIRNNRKLYGHLLHLTQNLRPSIEVLFDGNNLTQVISQAFRPPGESRSPLRTINLRNNQITVVHANAFFGLYNIERLLLDNNLIDTITDEAFSFAHSESHYQIGLSNNRLSKTSLSQRSFTFPVENSFVMDLSDNLFTTIREDLFAHVVIDLNTTHNTINFGGNQFVCDCAMNWINQYRVNDSIRNVFCVNKQKYITELTENDLCGRF